MKLKNVVFISALNFIVLNQVINGQGIIPRRGTPTGGQTLTNSGGQLSNPASVVLADNGISCDSTSTQNFVSLSFLKNITDPNVNTNNLVSLKKVGNDRYSLNIAKHVKACTNFKLLLFPSDNNYLIRVQNNFNFNQSNIDMDGVEDFSKLSLDEKYFRCLKKKNLIKENGEFDYAKAESNGDMSYGQTFSPFTINSGDGSRSIRAYFASPVATQYPNEPTKDSIKTPSNLNCVVFNDFSNNSTVLYESEYDRVKESALKACQSENAEQILKELTSLRESNLGNYKELEKILWNAFEKEQEKRTEEIYKRMKDIEREMRDRSMSEDIARDLAEEYSDLAKELSRVLIIPSMERIDSLLKMRNNSNKDEIDEEIKRINKRVGAYNKRNKKDFSRMAENLKKYALTEEARDIEGIRLASEFYSRVYEGPRDGRREGRLSLDAAKREIKKRIEKFEERLGEWEADYATRQGDKGPILAQRRAIQRQTRQMREDAARFRRLEQTNTKKYCGSNMLGMVRNPYQCKRWMADAGRRQNSFLRRRARSTSSLRRNTDIYSSLMDNYETFKVAEMRSSAYDTSDPYGYYEEFDHYSNFDIMGSPGNYSHDPFWNYSMQNPMMGASQTPPFGMRLPATGGGPSFMQQGMPGGSYTPSFLSGGNPYVPNGPVPYMPGGPRPPF